MKKLAIYMMSLSFTLLLPLYAIAQGPDERPAVSGDQEAAQQAADPQDDDMQAACCGQSSSRMEGMRRGKGMRGNHMLAGRMPWFYLKHAKDLNLSEEQEASLKKISSDLKKEMITKGADVRVRRLELSDILARPDYKLEDAAAKLKQIEDARLTLESAVLQYSTQARDVLTPDQLKKLKDIRRPGHTGKSCGNKMRRR